MELQTPERSQTDGRSLGINHSDFWGLSLDALSKWPEQKVRASCVDLGLEFKTLEDSRLEIARFCGIEMGNNPKDKKESTPQQLIEHLNRHMRQKRLCELHTHFLGMGSDDFWYTEIMTQRLPSLQLPKTANGKDWGKTLNACFGRLETSLKDHLKKKSGDIPLRELIEDDMWKKMEDSQMEMDDDTIKKFIQKHLSKDVVYSLEKLCTAFQPDSPEERGVSDDTIDIQVDDRMFANFKVGSRRSREHTFAVMSQAIRDATPEPKKDAERTPWYDLHVIFNCMSRKFELVLGVTNAQMVQWSKQDEPERGKRGSVGGKYNEVTVLESKLRNAFAMLEDDGSPAGSSRISQYRGKFDPEFCPQRFALRDCIVEQRPEVLSHLMAHICERYERSGVFYIELSASAKDLLNPTFWYHVTKAFATKLKGLDFVDGKQKVKEKRTAPPPGTPNSTGDGRTPTRSPPPMDEVEADPVTKGMAQSPATVDEVEEVRYPKRGRFIEESAAEPSSRSQSPGVLTISVKQATVQPVEADAGQTLPLVSLDLERPSSMIASQLPALQSSSLTPVGSGLSTKQSTSTGALKRKASTKSAAPKQGPFADVQWLSQSKTEIGKPRGQIVLFLAAFIRDIAFEFFSEEARQVLESKTGIPQYVQYDLIRLLGASVPSVLEKLGHQSVTVEGEKTLQVDKKWKEWKESVLGVMAHALARHWASDPGAWLSHLAETIGPDRARWEDIFADEKMLEKMFPKNMKNIRKMLEVLRYQKPIEVGAELTEADVINTYIQDRLREFCVGFDLVGCEVGRPFSPFLHSKSIELIEEFLEMEKAKKRRSAFGIRFHCGELVPRRVARSDKSDPGLVAHLQVTIDTIELLSKRFKHLRFRIGHGVAFIHKVSNPVLIKNMKRMHHFLKTKQIPIEVNLTSNNILIADTFVHEEFGPADVLRGLNELGLRLILSTDDDGICPIYECKAHGRHISVSREFCLAIETKLLKTVHDIDSLISTAMNCAFVFPRRKRANGKGDLLQDEDESVMNEPNDDEIVAKEEEEELSQNNLDESGIN